MTLAEIRASTEDVLIPKDIAGVLGCHEHSIRLAAKEKDLPFPVVVIGSRVKIPREAFLRWFDGEGGERDGRTGMEQ